jgi:putative FmdB family regulatory protein
MARYEFRCRECGSTFEVDRPMQRSSEPADCPEGHSDTVKLLSSVALGGKARTATRPVTPPSPYRGGGGGPMGAPPPMGGGAPGGGGGCCGGGCGCG